MKSFCHIYAQFDQTGDRIEAEWKHLAGLGLICDTTFNFGPQAERNHAVLADIVARGGLVAPNIYPATMDPACRDPNWWKYSEEECVRLLGRARDRFAALDLGPMLAVNTYTPGNGFVAACRRLDIRYILGFCAPTIIEDGGWSISQYGAPLTPYFVSPDDFRKPEAPADGRLPVLMASMETRNPLVCLNHWSEGPWGPLNAQAADRWLEPSGQPYPFLQVAEDQLRLGAMTGTTTFFHINLQYFFAGRCYDHNRRALEWLALQRDQGRLEIGSLQTWSARMQEEGGFLPQTSYWRGEMMGFHVGHRPGSVADVIVDENLERQAVWQYPEACPRRCYDFTGRWQYPPFAPHGDAPASETYVGVEVSTRAVATAGTTRSIDITLSNAGAPRRVPLALWDLLQDCAGPFIVSTPSAWTARVVPHPAGVGGAILLEGTVPVGITHLSLAIGFGATRLATHLRRWGTLLEAQTFEDAQQQPYTYLATQTPERFVITVRARAESVHVESLCGVDYETRALPRDGLSLTFDGTRLAGWHRLWGVRAGDLEIEGVAEVEARLRRQTSALAGRLDPELELPAPGYQLFGNIRDEARWDRTLARAAGADELQRMGLWFRGLRPQSGASVIEVHPGIFLPRGSITKVLGHEFDLIHCEAGYGFKELCADYPQGWDWGVAAWVQWRHLRVQLEGLSGRRERHILHLHAFDPEGRDISQRVHFFNPEAAEVAPLLDQDPGVRSGAELCVVTHWELPRGLEGRWEAGALCSIRIPEECQTWSAIGVWISPLEKMKLYDWVAERGASGLFCHLWVTREPERNV